MKILNLLKKLDVIVLGVLKWLVIVIFMVMTFILAANVVIRYFPIISLHWLDEIVELLFSGLVFYGAAGVWILKGHFSAGEMIGKLFKSRKVKSFLRLFSDAASFVFIFIVFKYSMDLVALSLENSTVFQIPKKINYSAISIGAGIMVLYSIKFIVQDLINIFRPATDSVKEEGIA